MIFFLLIAGPISFEKTSIGFLFLRLLLRPRTQEGRVYRAWPRAVARGGGGGGRQWQNAAESEGGGNLTLASLEVKVANGSTDWGRSEAGERLGCLCVLLTRRGKVNLQFELNLFHLFLFEKKTFFNDVKDSLSQ